MIVRAAMLVLGLVLGAMTGAVAQDYPEYPRMRGPMGPMPQPKSERIVAGVSRGDISITTSFAGSELLVYGAVRREVPVDKAAPLDVIVTVQGPNESLTVRRKSRRLGVWVNADAVVIGAAPNVYAVATSGPLAQILAPQVDTRERISVPLALRAFARPLTVADTVPFTEAMLRLKTGEGKYKLAEGSVTLLDDTLFRADVNLPANLIEGDYRLRIFLLRGGEVVDRHDEVIEVRKVGVERWLYQMAFDQPLLYGLMSIAVAVAAGWGASAAFRVARRG